jgi:hypothetical protein
MQPSDPHGQQGTNMTPDQIAEIIRSTMRPDAQSNWQQEARGTIAGFLRLYFRPKIAMFLDIKAAIDHFDPLYSVSWAARGGEENDQPCIAIKGRVRGQAVEAIFVLASND